MAMFVLNHITKIDGVQGRSTVKGGVAGIYDHVSSGFGSKIIGKGVGARITVNIVPSNTDVCAETNATGGAGKITEAGSVVVGLVDISNTG